MFHFCLLCSCIGSSFICGPNVDLSLFPATYVNSYMVAGTVLSNDCPQPVEGLGKMFPSLQLLKAKCCSWKLSDLINFECLAQEDCQVRCNDFGPCSKTCGPGGVQTKICKIAVEPKFGGKGCPPLVETHPCQYNPPCDVNCRYRYSDFSECDCNGTQHRELIIQQQPTPGGEKCPPPVDTQPCPTPPSCDSKDRKEVISSFMSCKNLPDGQYPDPRSECSNVFFTCLKGVAMENICPKGDYYDIAQYKCNRFALVLACSIAMQRQLQLKPPESSKANLHIILPLLASVVLAIMATTLGILAWHRFHTTAGELPGQEPPPLISFTDESSRIRELEGLIHYLTVNNK